MRESLVAAILRERLELRERQKMECYQRIFKILEGK